MQPAGLDSSALLLGAVGPGLTREFIRDEYLRPRCRDPARIRTCLADGDAKSARELVHTLEGASAMVGAVGVRGAVADLAAALRADADKTAIDRLLATCDAAISQFAALDAGRR